jgi:hypothetical protein
LFLLNIIKPRIWQLPLYFLYDKDTRNRDSRCPGFKGSSENYKTGSWEAGKPGS